jgi:hypothetical protein
MSEHSDHIFYTIYMYHPNNTGPLQQCTEVCRCADAVEKCPIQWWEEVAVVLAAVGGLTPR